MLSGRFWQTTDVRGRQIFANQLRKPETGLYRKSPFDSFSKLYVDYATGALVKQQVFSNTVAAEEVPFFRRGENCLIFHFLGELHSEIWRLFLTEERKLKINNFEGLFFVAEDISDFELRAIPEAQEEALAAVSLKNFRTFSEYLDLGRFFNMLPPAMQREEFLKHIELAKFNAFLRKLRFIEVDPSAVSQLVE